MTVSANHIQDEHIDVNNMWQYPDGFDTYPSTTPISKLTPQFWKIGTFNTTGYNAVSTGRTASWMCSFTDMSITSKGRSAGYMAAMMLGLEAGKYIMSFTADQDGQVKFVQYMTLEDGCCVNNESNSYGVVKSFLTGRNEFEFAVPPGNYVMMLFCQGNIASTTSIPVTLSEIKIREGVLQ